MSDDLTILFEQYNQRKKEIKGDEHLSDKGKYERLKELARDYRAALQAELDNVYATKDGLSEKLQKLKDEVPEGRQYSEQELLTEQRDCDLLISKLRAGGPDNFIDTCRQVAVQKPAVYMRAYNSVLEQFDSLFPRGADNDPYGGKTFDPETENRAHIYQQVDKLYRTASEAVVTPEEQKRQAAIDRYDGARLDCVKQQIHIDRMLQNVNGDLAGIDAESFYFNRGE